jgi:hypothetical protein
MILKAMECGSDVAWMHRNSVAQMCQNDTGMKLFKASLTPLSLSSTKSSFTGYADAYEWINPVELSAFA